MESGNETKLTLNLEQLACNDWDLGTKSRDLGLDTVILHHLQPVLGSWI